MNPPPKSIFKSKLALSGAVATVAGALGTFAPELAPAISIYGSQIILGFGILNVVLRFFTKGRVVLFAE